MVYLGNAFSINMLDIPDQGKVTVEIKDLSADEARAALAEHGFKSVVGASFAPSYSEQSSWFGYSIQPRIYHSHFGGRSYCGPVSRSSTRGRCNRSAGRSCNKVLQGYDRIEILFAVPPELGSIPCSGVYFLIFNRENIESDSV